MRLIDDLKNNGFKCWDYVHSSDKTEYRVLESFSRKRYSIYLKSIQKTFLAKQPPWPSFWSNLFNPKRSTGSNTIYISVFKEKQKILEAISWNCKIESFIKKTREQIILFTVGPTQ